VGAASCFFVRDVILYQEGLLRSETLCDKSDYEDHQRQLTQFLEFIKEEYKKVEHKVGLPLDTFLQGTLIASACRRALFASGTFTCTGS
jgi:hypothetical protein